MDQIRVLCVDDEPHILEGLALQLHRGYEVVPALSGAEGVTALQTKGPFAVVLSDMRMPGMDGATFLGRVRELAPDTTRMLLTGHTDIEAAIAAVNHGQIFRFLTKPCPPDQLRLAFAAAAEQHRLVTAERVLLKETLVGSIKVLVDILAMISPLVFCKATRLRRYVKEIAEHLGITNGWALEIAAMLSQLGYITIPEDVARRHYFAMSLSPEEEVMIGRVPKVTESLLARIPRLEPARTILAQCAALAGDSGSLQNAESRIGLEARVLRFAIDFDKLDARGITTPMAFLILGKHRRMYGDEIFATFAAIQSAFDGRQEVRQIAQEALSEGMIFAEDVRSTGGALLASRGSRVTLGLLESMRNFRRGNIQEPIRVIVGVGGA